jgi:hypothetical protein
MVVLEVHECDGVPDGWLKVTLLLSLCCSLCHTKRAAALSLCCSLCHTKRAAALSAAHSVIPSALLSLCCSLCHTKRAALSLSAAHSVIPSALLLSLSAAHSVIPSALLSLSLLLTLSYQARCCSLCCFRCHCLHHDNHYNSDTHTATVKQSALLLVPRLTQPLSKPHSLEGSPALTQPLS